MIKDKNNNSAKSSDNFEKDMLMLSHIDSTFRLIIMTYGIILAIMTVFYKLKSLAVFVTACIILFTTILFGFYTLIEWGNAMSNTRKKYIYLAYYYTTTILLLIMLVAIVYYYISHRNENVGVQPGVD